MGSTRGGPLAAIAAIAVWGGTAVAFFSATTESHAQPSAGASSTAASASADAGSACEKTAVDACSQKWSDAKTDCARKKAARQTEIEQARSTAHRRCASACRMTQTPRGALPCCATGLGNGTCGAPGTTVEQIRAQCTAAQERQASSEIAQAVKDDRACVEAARIENRNCLAACGPPDLKAIGHDLTELGPKWLSGCAGYGTSKPLKVTVQIDSAGVISFLRATQAAADSPSDLCMTPSGQVACPTDYPAQCAASTIRNNFEWRTVPFTGSPIQVTFTVRPEAPSK